MKNRRPIATIIAVLIIFISLTYLMVPAAAQNPDIGISGSVDLDKVKEDETVLVSATVTNNGATDIEDYSAQIFIFKSTPDMPQKTKLLTLPANGGVNHVDYRWTAKGSGEFTVLVRVVDDLGVPQGDKELPTKITVQKVEDPVENPLYMELIPGIPLLYILILVIIIVVIVVVVVVAKKKKKKKGTEVEVTGEGVEVTGRVAWGKMPANYYTERRERLTKLRPVGLTRDGRTILGNSTVGERGIEAVDVVDQGSQGDTGPNNCEKCGYEMEANWRTCLRCDASFSILDAKSAMKELGNLEVQADQAEILIRQADASFQSENFTEVEMYVRDAKTLIQQAKREAEMKKKEEEAEATSEEAMGTTAQEEEGPKTPDNCTGCGMGLQSDWDKCPVCGMTVEDMLKVVMEPEPTPELEPQVEEASPVVEVETPKCSICGNDIETEGGPCVHCNTNRAVSNAEVKIKELRLVVQDQTLDSEMQLEVNEAMDLYQDAKGAFFDKDYPTAVGLAGETIDMVEELLPRLGGAPGPAPTPTPTPTPTPAPEEGPNCPNCGMKVKPNWEICPGCEASLKEAPTPAPTPAPAPASTKCPGCGKTVKERWAMCPYCEASLK